MFRKALFLDFLLKILVLQKMLLCSYARTSPPCVGGIKDTYSCMCLRIVMRLIMSVKNRPCSEDCQKISGEWKRGNICL